MSKPRVLIVDDDTKISNFLHAILAKAGGFEVREENRSYAAVPTALEFRPAGVLLDIDMPGKDGGEIAAELAAHPCLSSIPVLFITSLVHPEGAWVGPLKLGRHYFLAKPVLPKTLLDVVESMVGGRSKLALEHGSTRA